MHLDSGMCSNKKNGPQPKELAKLRAACSGSGTWYAICSGLKALTGTGIGGALRGIAAPSKTPQRPAAVPLGARSADFRKEGFDRWPGFDQFDHAAGLPVRVDIGESNPGGGGAPLHRLDTERAQAFEVLIERCGHHAEMLQTFAAARQ